MRKTIKTIGVYAVMLLPLALFMFPFYKDLYEQLQRQKEVKAETIRYTVSAPEYTATPTENENISGQFYVMRTVAYCPCEKCCGWNTGITYSGTVATQGRTVACNLDRFPIGTKLMIDGHEYIVEDTGHLSENMIDIYFDSHEEALKYGSQWKAVEVIE